MREATNTNVARCPRSAFTFAAISKLGQRRLEILTRRRGSIGTWRAHLHLSAPSFRTECAPGARPNR